MFLEQITDRETDDETEPECSAYPCITEKAGSFGFPPPAPLGADGLDFVPIDIPEGDEGFFYHLVRISLASAAI